MEIGARRRPRDDVVRSPARKFGGNNLEGEWNALLVAIAFV